VSNIYRQNAYGVRLPTLTAWPKFDHIKYHAGGVVSKLKEGFIFFPFPVSCDHGDMGVLVSTPNLIKYPSQSLSMLAASNDTLRPGCFSSATCEWSLPTNLLPIMGFVSCCTTQSFVRSLPILITLVCVVTNTCPLVFVRTNTCIVHYGCYLLCTLALEYHQDRRQSETGPGNLRFVAERRETTRYCGSSSRLRIMIHESDGTPGYPYAVLVVERSSRSESVGVQGKKTNHCS